MPRPDNPLERTPLGELYRGSAIRDLRHQTDWSIDEFARRLDIHPASLSKIETNRARPSDHLLERIAEELNTSLARLQQAPLHPDLDPAATGNRSLRLGGGFQMRPDPGNKVQAGSSAPRTAQLKEILSRLWELEELVEGLLEAEISSDLVEEVPGEMKP